MITNQIDTVEIENKLNKTKIKENIIKETVELIISNQTKNFTESLAFNSTKNNTKLNILYSSKVKDKSNNKNSTSFNNITKNKIKNNKTISNETKNKSQDNKNSSSQSNFSLVIYKITSPDEEDLNTLSYILSLQSQQANYHKICYQCLDNISFLKKLNEEIRLVKQDMFSFSNGFVFTRQELIVKFSDYINRVNMVKIELFEMRSNLDLLKASKCPNYDDNLKNYEGIMVKANQLIEIIQESIRKQNLNINFIVIT